MVCPRAALRLSRIRTLSTRAPWAHQPASTTRTDAARPSWARQPAPQTIVPVEETDATTLQLEAVDTPEGARTLSCCLIGPTNAGKSTMLNALVNSSVSIVSSRIHTTRENTLGFLTDTSLPHRPTQVEFIDAPGALGPHVPSLHRAMWDAVRSSDLALVVVDASDRRPLGAVGQFLEQLRTVLDEQARSGGGGGGGSSSGGGGDAVVRPPTQTVLVLNKVDKVRPKARLLELSAELHARHDFDWPCFMVSASKRHGLDELRGWLLLQSAPCSAAREWAVPARVTHMQTPLQLATEIIRAQLFAFFKEELPYTLHQRNLGWTELPNGDLRIDQELVAPPKRSARAIVRRRLPGVGKAARPYLSRALGRNVHLFLSVGSEREGG